MEELKQKGNDAFVAKNFKEAIDWYTKAIAVAPENYVLYNNRAAAHHESRQYDDAVTDARKSISISANAKGYNRLAAAYWAQNRLELALGAYDTGLALFPNDAPLNAGREKLKAKMDAAQQRTPLGQERTPQPTAPAQGAGDTTAALIDCGIVFSFIIHFIFSLFSPALALLMWKVGMGMMISRCVTILRHSGGLQLNMAALRGLTTSFAGQYLILCALFMFMVPQITIFTAITIYATVDLATTQRGVITTMMPPSLLVRLDPKLAILGMNRQPLLINAAILEIAAIPLAPLFGGSLYTIIILLQFAKARYSTDAFAKTGWREVRISMEKIFHHPRCPAPLTSLFHKVSDGLYQLAMR